MVSYNEIWVKIIPHDDRQGGRYRLTSELVTIVINEGATTDESKSSELNLIGNFIDTLVYIQKVYLDERDYERIKMFVSKECEPKDIALFKRVYKLHNDSCHTDHAFIIE